MHMRSARILTVKYMFPFIYIQFPYEMHAYEYVYLEYEWFVFDTQLKTFDFSAY